MTKFFSSLIIILIAYIFELIFVSNNIIIDFVFAVLVVLPFLFLEDKRGLLKMLFFVIFGAFLINWYPFPSFDIIIFALLPIVVYLLSKKFLSKSLFCVIGSIIFSFLTLYLLIEPSFVFHYFNIFLLDLFISLIFGILVFISMDNFYK